MHRLKLIWGAMPQNSLREPYFLQPYLHGSAPTARTESSDIGALKVLVRLV